MLRTYKACVKGITPLLFAKPPEIIRTRRADEPVNKPVEEQVEESLYHDNGKVFVPDTWFYQAMVKSAAGHKFEGKKTYKEIIGNGIRIAPLQIPLISDQKEPIPFIRPVRDTKGQLKMRGNARYNDWKFEFTIMVMDQRIQSEKLEEILKDAGIRGIGGWHSRFGKFEVEKFKEVH